MIIQRNVERDRLIPVITLRTYVVVNFFILGNFSFSFVSVSLAYITILKNQRKQKLPEKKNQLVTTKFIFLTEDTLFVTVHMFCTSQQRTLGKSGLFIIGAFSYQSILYGLQLSGRTNRT